MLKATRPTRPLIERMTQKPFIVTLLHSLLSILYKAYEKILYEKYRNKSDEFIWMFDKHQIKTTRYDVVLQPLNITYKL